MQINDTIFRELIKRGYSRRKNSRVWDISDSKLWYLTPELSKGFLQLYRYNPYKINVIERELHLIRRYANSIVKGFGKKHFNLVDLGCGNGIKSSLFIKSIKTPVSIRYCPVDISKDYIKVTGEKIKLLKSHLIRGVKPFVSDFKDLDDIIPLLTSPKYRSNLVLLLGGTISHYEINDFLYTLRNGMMNDSVLVIGNGVRKGRRFVSVDKYKDPLFNKWFIHIMKGLGFEEDEVKYDARFTSVRLEGYYTILTDKVIDYEGKHVRFKKGDEVIVAIQYKYFPDELLKFCKMYFREGELILDKDEEYCLIVCKK